MLGEENREILGWDLGVVDLFLLRRMRFGGLEEGDGMVGEGFVALGWKVGHECLDFWGRCRLFPRVDRISCT
jgi:hypothetical protein